jgi:hypothetical protein
MPVLQQHDARVGRHESRVNALSCTLTFLNVMLSSWWDRASCVNHDRTCIYAVRRSSCCCSVEQLGCCPSARTSQRQDRTLLWVHTFRKRLKIPESRSCDHLGFRAQLERVAIYLQVRNWTMHERHACTNISIRERTWGCRSRQLPTRLAGNFRGS